MGGQQIQGLGDAVEDTDAVNKGQLDAAVSGAGTVTSVAISVGSTGLSVSGSPITTSGTITLAGTLAVANGGTGATSLTANNVILGNGTSAVQFVAPSTPGNVLTSNGTTWTSAAPSGNWTLLTKSSNQNLTTSSTSFQDVSDLSFSVTNGGTYAFRAVILAYSPATGSNGGGLKVAVTGPTASTLFAGNLITGTAPAYDATIVHTTSQVFAIYIPLEIYGVVTVSADGTFKIRAAQHTATTGTSVVYAGSWLEYRAI